MKSRCFLLRHQAVVSLRRRGWEEWVKGVYKMFLFVLQDKTRQEPERLRFIHKAGIYDGAKLPSGAVKDESKSTFLPCLAPTPKNRLLSQPFGTSVGGGGGSHPGLWWWRWWWSDKIESWAMNRDRQFRWGDWEDRHKSSTLLRFRRKICPSISFPSDLVFPGSGRMKRRRDFGGEMVT